MGSGGPGDVTVVVAVVGSVAGPVSVVIVLVVVLIVVVVVVFVVVVLLLLFIITSIFITRTFSSMHKYKYIHNRIRGADCSQVNQKRH